MVVPLLSTCQNRAIRNLSEANLGLIATFGDAVGKTLPNTGDPEEPPLSAMTAGQKV